MSISVPNLSNLNILLLDKNSETIEVIAQHLQIAGATVVLATSSQEAVEYFDLVNPTIIIVSLELNQDNAFLFLLKVKVYKGKADIPAIAIAEHSDREGEIAIAAGFNAYLRTPIEAARLYATISQFIK